MSVIQKLQMRLLTLDQTTSGLGTPLASHDSLMAVPSLAMYWSGPGLISGGTVEEEGCKEQLSDWPRSGCQHPYCWWKTARNISIKRHLHYKLMMNCILTCLSISADQTKPPHSSNMQEARPLRYDDNKCLNHSVIFILHVLFFCFLFFCLFRQNRFCGQT